jgi:hypothetical protein
VFGFVLVVIAAVSIVPVLVPPLRGDTQVDIAAVRRHIEAIAAEPHPMGTPQIERVRSYILGELAGAGILPETQAVEAPDYFGTAGGDTVEVVNILARIRGRSSTGSVLLVAHYDTVPTTPGANDNSMAVANLIELGRTIRSGQPLLNDVILLFTDGEEPAPRYGATAFMKHPWANDVAVVFNLEAVGETGPSMVVELAGGASVVGGYSAAMDEPVAFSFMTQTAELIGGAASDFDVFREAGVPGLNFATFRGSAIYHTANDSIDRINDEVIGHQGATAYALVAHFGEVLLPTSTTGSEDAFFTLGRSTLVRHPISWLPALLAAAAMGLAALVVLRARSRNLRLGTALVDSVIVLGGGLLAVGAGSLLWMVVVALFPSIGVAASYLALIVVAVVVGGIASWLVLWRSGIRGDSLLTGVLMVWLVLAAALVAGAPGAAYVLVWPLVIATVAALSMPLWRWRWAWVIGASIVAAVALPLTVPVIDTFFLLAGPRPGNPGSELPYVIAVSVLCGYLVAVLIGATALAGSRSTDGLCSRADNARQHRMVEAGA